MPYSPWLDAGKAFHNAGEGLDRANIGLTRLRQAEQMFAERDRLAQMNQMMRQQLQQAQIGRIGVQNQLTQGQVDQLPGRANLTLAEIDRNRAAANLDNEKIRAAIDLGSGYSKLYPQDLSQGPSLGNERQMTLGGIANAAGRSAALHGNVTPLLMPHNVPHNSIAMNPISGDVTSQGPILLGKDQMYQMPGQMPVSNPSPFMNVPAGATVMDTQSRQPVMTAPGRVAGQELSKNNALNAYTKMLAMQDLDRPVDTNMMNYARQVVTNKPPAIPSGVSGRRRLDPDTAKMYVQRAGGDNNAARRLAAQDGYDF